ncbi:MAG TPA: type 1 glutamine amidotransferase [Stenotrophobium sp.]|jgi:GMP synthase-like glutamine amidotransferase|nr:type 1 glutamine amidotransferase [Stenotrophobium sp.]
MSLRVHWLQHVAFEDLGCIAPWLAARNATVTQTRLYAGETLPKAGDFDWLIVMGGPMNIYEESAHPWLVAEKALIREACAAGRRLLGICLGAQLIADALGAPVTRNAHREIGWFPVQMNAAAASSKLFAGFPERYDALHWHGDTFAIPPGATLLAGSEACAHQAYEYAGRVAAIQFHLEVTAADARVWLAQETPAPGRYVQTAGEILVDIGRFAENNRLMRRLLENLAAA